jgi:hypothetical protein
MLRCRLTGPVAQLGPTPALPVGTDGNPVSGQRSVASGLEQLVYILQGDVAAVVQEGWAQSQHQVSAGMAAFSPLQTPHMSWVDVGFLAQAVAGQPGPGAHLEKGFGELQSVSSLWLVSLNGSLWCRYHLEEIDRAMNEPKRLIPVWQCIMWPWRFRVGGKQG